MLRKGFINKHMEIISNVKDGILYVKLEGDIDHHSAKNVRDSVDDLMRKTNPAELELDLSAVEFMDSSGLGLVLGRYKKQTDMGGRMKILNPTRRVMQILQLAGVEKIIKIERIRQL
jgi:stage II sporulation protein AA (anti-sigma F factor antagonist)